MNLPKEVGIALEIAAAAAVGVTLAGIGVGVGLAAIVAVKVSNKSEQTWPIISPFLNSSSLQYSADN